MTRNFLRVIHGSFPGNLRVKNNFYGSFTGHLRVEKKFYGSFTGHKNFFTGPKNLDNMTNILSVSECFV